MRRELQSAGYDPAYTRVDMAEAMREALDRSTYDLVVCEYAMPHFGASEALALLKARDLDLPFIIVSNTIDEHVAAAALKTGAHDYIMKTNPARLAPAVARELRQAEIRCAARRAEEEIRQYAASAAELIRVAARLNSKLDLETILNAVCEECSRTLGAPAASISLHDSDRAALGPTATLGLPREFREQYTPRMIDGTFARQQGSLTVVPDVRVVPELPHFELYGRHDIRTIVSASLLREDQLIGTLNVYSFGEPRVFNRAETSLLQGVADQAASAIENARLFAETKRRLQYMQASKMIDMAISASLDLRVTLNVLLDQVTAQLGVDAAAVLLLNATTQALEYASGRGFRAASLQNTRLRLGEGYAGRAALERHIVTVPNLTDAPGEFARSQILLNEEFVAYYAVPLIARGEVRGVLELFHRTPLNPNREWLDFLETVTGQAGIAIDHAALFDGLRRAHIDLILAYDTTLEGWSRALDLRDRETEGHTQRVTDLTIRLAHAMGVGDAELVHVRRGALLHDIGKMGIPDAILHKPGPLTDEEWEIMRKHPVYAHELLSTIPYLSRALEIPHCHHEKWDGTGYPRALKGEQIPLAARIFALADVWDAMISDRPYRPALTADKAREYFREQAGKHFDPRVVEAFLGMGL